MTVYLLHFDRPISPDHTTQHYLGFTDGRLADRLTAHAKGGGARLTQVAFERGIGWSLVRTWTGATRRDERRLKASKFLNRLCPTCHPRTRRGLRILHPDGSVAWQRKRLCRPRLRFAVESVAR